MNKNNKKSNESLTLKKVEAASLEKKVVKSSLDSNYNLEILEGTNAFYSERYGWTLKRK
jgi:hypothetical protein|tara:strand:- start:1269 stop:1445 length:177 start_codon:yes stop_codon:yes gene_type:complete